MLPNGVISLAIVAAATQMAAGYDLQPLPQPAGCPLPDKPWKFSKFRWYKGSHGVDCTSGNGDDENKQGCLRNDEKAWYPPPPAPCNNGTLRYLCSSGLNNPDVALPWGYGPWENLNVTLPGGEVCRDSYQGFRAHTIGEGQLGNTIGPPHVGFVGKANKKTSKAVLSYGIDNYLSLKCANGKHIAYYGNTTVTLKCDIDKFKNSTCTTPDVVVPVKYWAYDPTLDD